MKFLILFLLPFALYAQDTNRSPYVYLEDTISHRADTIPTITTTYYEKVSSPEWKVLEVPRKGRADCEHDWVYSGEYNNDSTAGYSFVTDDAYWYYSGEDEARICKRCGRKEIRGFFIVYTEIRRGHTRDMTPYEIEEQRWQTANSVR